MPPFKAIQNTEILFDQYSRYRACFEIIKLTGFSSHQSLLDVGSGPECLLGQFMPDSNITFIDPLIQNDIASQKIKGSIFSDQLESKVFSCVASVDVFEHIPATDRPSFLDRVSTLSNNLIILGFPCLDGCDAATTDEAINSKYKSIFNCDYPWIKDHQIYGLPSASEAISHLQAKGWHCQSVGHGHAPWLKELLGFVVCALEVDEMKEILIDVSKRFNNHLYLEDFRPPHYRKFIIASRKPLPKISFTYSSDEESANQIFFDIMKYRDTQYFRSSTLLLSSLRAIDEELKNTKSLLNKMENSISWKITSPLRFLASLVRYQPRN